MTDPAKCKHPLKYKVTDDTREYCPSCGKYLYEYFGGVDPAFGDIPVVYKKHPDGTIEQVDRKFLRLLIDEAWNMVTESGEVPATPWADEIIDETVKKFQNGLED